MEQDAPKEDELLTVPEAAVAKGVHLKSVYRAISEGRLKVEKRYGRLLIRQRELDAWEPWQPEKRQREPQTGS